MDGFFVGWQRQTGCVTLVMACLVATGWVRALNISDVVRIDLGRRQHRVFTVRDRIHWASYESQGKNWSSPVVWMTSEPFDIPIFFTLGEIAPVKDYRIWEISFQSVVLPLTLIAAGLILRPLRSATITRIRSDREV